MYMGDTPVANDYLQIQEHFVVAMYGERAAGSTSWQGFVHAVNCTKFQPFINDYIKIFNVIQNAELTRKQSNAILSLLSGYAGDKLKIPKDIRTLSQRILNHSIVSDNCVIETMEWPEFWRMHLWDKHDTNRPNEVKLIVRDPIHCISLQFMNPEIAFGWRSHIHFDYEEDFDSSTNQRRFGDLYTSEWMRKTQSKIRDPEGKVLPIIIYSDGVSVGTRDSVTSVLGTCGLYSDELQRTNTAKFCLGYIDGLYNLPLEKLLSHFRNKCGMSKQSAAKAIQYFSMKIDRRCFWRTCFKSIEKYAFTGVKLRLLGDSNSYSFYPVLAFTVGDEVSQKRMCGIFAGHPNRNCIHCNYHSNSVLPYNPKKVSLRNPEELKDITTEAELLLENDPFRKRKDTKEILSKLASHCAYPVVSILHSVPMGEDNHIFKTPYDVFHVFCAGLMKHAAFWILTIIDNLSKLDRKFQDSPG